MSAVRQLARVALAQEGDVVAARLGTRRLAAELGLDSLAQTRLATAVSEVARNALVHGGGGEVTIAVEDDAPPRFVVQVIDHGPGLADLDEALAERSRRDPRHASGLQNAQRLVDDLTVSPTAGGGATVRLALRLPAARRGAAAAPARRGRAAAPKAPPAPLDPMALLREQDRDLAESLAALQERQRETERLNDELEETNRGVVALYSELDDKAEQLRQASEAKSRFLSHMSHEFRTPLNSILALARLLLDGVDGELNPEQARQVEYVRRSAQSLLDMVNDLLDLAKVEAGKVDVKVAPFALADLLGSLRGALRPLQTNPRVRLTFPEDAEALPGMVSDEAKIAQILRNLVANALRFTEAGEVAVRCHHDAALDRVTFEVADSGIGIEAHHLDAIFEEFTQIEGRLQRGGTGLGLPLSRRLAHLLGGELTVRSTPGAGSVFRLVVPRDLGVPAETQPLAPARRLLVIDDEETFRYVIRHIAADAGFAVDEAADGAAGLDCARQNVPQAIVLDLQMPGVDGFHTLAALQRDERLAAVPVIICTSKTLSAQERLLLGRAHSVLPKHELSREGLRRLLQSIDPPLGGDATEAAR